MQLAMPALEAQAILTGPNRAQNEPFFRPPAKWLESVQILSGTQ